MPRTPKSRPEPVAKPTLGDGQATRLKQARTTKGYSLRDLSIASGVSTSAISAIESGAKGEATCQTIAALADALGVKRGWLAFGTEIHEPQ